MGRQRRKRAVGRITAQASKLPQNSARMTSASDGPCQFHQRAKIRYSKTVGGVSAFVDFARYDFDASAE